MSAAHPPANQRFRWAPGAAWARVREFLPRGQTLPFETWRVRHRGILILLWAHVPVLAAFGLWRGIESPGHVLFEVGVIGAIATVACLKFVPRRIQTALACFGLIVSSAILTHFSGGYIEAHFHFFVMMGVIVLYEDWLPFLLSILYVVLHHGVAGTIAPASVYNHPAGIADPWLWGFIHAFFILGLCLALTVYWRSEERARSRSDHVLRAAGEGIIGVDRDGRIAFANLAASDLARRPPGTMEGQPASSFFTALPEPDGGNTSRGEAALLRAKNPLPVEISTTRASNGAGSVATVIAFRDISERKKAETEIQENLSLLEATLEATDNGILVVDRKGRIVRFNQPFARMWRLSQQVLDARDDARAIQEVQQQLVDPEAFLAKVAELYGHPEAESHDVLHFKDGRVFDRHSKPQWIGDQVVGRVWSFHDVTQRVEDEKTRRENERRRREAEEREKEIERLKELDRFKTDFINATAHELNTPLTPIKVQLHLLKTKPDSFNTTDRYRNVIQVLDRNVTRLEKLIQDELEIARLDSGRVELRPGPVNLLHLVDEVVASFDEAAKLKNLSLGADVRTGATIVADEARLLQVLYNLVGNALKFTPEGGTITVGAKDTENGVQVEVADTGIGMTPEQRSRLFNPFSQVHDHRTDAPQGTGLGLYITRGILALHQATIRCDSPGEGRGTTFTIELPMDARSERDETDTDAKNAHRNVQSVPAPDPTHGAAATPGHPDA